MENIQTQGQILQDLFPSFRLIPRDSFILIASAALVRDFAKMRALFFCVNGHPHAFYFQVVHIIFKRWEPVHVAVVLPLLVFLPATLSTLLFPYHGALRGLAIGFLAFFATLGSSITLYRVSPFHPLARYPGPLPAKISMLWHIWKAWDGKQHLYIEDLHHRYGDIVRIGKCCQSIDSYPT